MCHWDGRPAGSRLELQPGISSVGARARPLEPHPQPGLSFPPWESAAIPWRLGEEQLGHSVPQRDRGDFLGWGGLLSTFSVFPRAPLVERRGVVGSQVAVPHPGGPLPLQAHAHSPNPL